MTRHAAEPARSRLGRSPRAWSRCAVALVFVSALGLSVTGIAQGAKYTLSPKTAKRLNEVHELIQADDLVAAKNILKSFRLDKMDPYPSALVLPILETTR